MYIYNCYFSKYQNLSDILVSFPKSLHICAYHYTLTPLNSYVASWLSHFTAAEFKASIYCTKSCDPS